MSLWGGCNGGDSIEAIGARVLAMRPLIGLGIGHHFCSRIYFQGSRFFLSVLRGWQLLVGHRLPV